MVTSWVVVLLMNFPSSKTSLPDFNVSRTSFIERLYRQKYGKRCYLAVREWRKMAKNFFQLQLLLNSNEIHITSCNSVGTTMNIKVIVKYHMDFSDQYAQSNLISKIMSIKKAKIGKNAFKNILSKIAWLSFCFGLSKQIRDRKKT